MVLESGITHLRLIAFLIAAVFFFSGTLLASFFVMIVIINNSSLVDIGPSLFMVGLVPPSFATFLFFTKILGRFL